VETAGNDEALCDYDSTLPHRLVKQLLANDYRIKQYQRVKMVSFESFYKYKKINITNKHYKRNKNRNNS
jgi:hypothetical protein